MSGGSWPSSLCVTGSRSWSWPTKPASSSRARDSGLARFGPWLYVEFRPHGLACLGLAHAPLGRQGVDEDEPEAGLAELIQDAWPRPLPVAVLDLDPQPGPRGVQGQLDGIGIPGMPDGVGEQFRDVQDSVVFQ